VFGAVTLVHQQTEMKTAHVARGGRRLASAPRKKMGNIRITLSETYETADGDQAPLFFNGLAKSSYLDRYVEGRLVAQHIVPKDS
jgi:hypothetical protein